MGKVLHRETDDGVALRWGDSGREYVVDPDDADELRKAYRAAVAEGLGKRESLEDEVDRSVAREIQGEVGIAKDAGGGLIVAYWPGSEVQQHLDSILPAETPGRTDASDLHMTILYLDDEGWREEGSGWDLQLVAAICKIFSTEWGPFDAKVGGLGRFVGPEDSDVLVALVDCPHVANFRRHLEDALYCRGAVPSGSALWKLPQHGFIPHFTLAYVGKGQETLPSEVEPYEFNVDNVTLASGETRVRFQLGYHGVSYDDAAEDPRPFYAARDAVKLQKAGRVLSEKNLGALEAAMATMAEVVAAERKRGRKPEEEADEEYAVKRAEFLAAVSGTTTDEDAGLVYAVTKAADEHRFTLGPLYAPDRKDAHGEYTDSSTLQTAVWDYVRQSRDEGGRLRLQHGDLGDITVAEMVEVMAWPYEHTIKVSTAGGEERELEMPAGTVYLGAIWDEDAWPLVKSGKIGGWSLGGKAVRVKEGVSADEMKSMGDKVLRREAPHNDDRLALLKVAADAEAALRERELEGARNEAGRLESIVGKLVDAVKVAAKREAQGDYHVHLPDQTITPVVNINESPLDPDPETG